MLKKRLAMAAVTVTALAALAGCFKNPSEPSIPGGTGSLPVNSSDRTTTGISATSSQVTNQGVYLSITNQDGSPLNPAYFRGANFQVTYNGQTISGGSISVSTANQSGQSICSSLIMDYSGSMASTDITNMETAASSFVNNMQTADRGEIIKFSDYPVVEQAYTSDKNALRTAVTRATSIAGGVTAFWDATYQGVTDTAHEVGQKAVVAFTDGYENNSSLITSQAQLISEARAHGVPIYTIGLGSADTTGLEAIASGTGGRYYYAPNSTQLAQVYQLIAQVLSNTIIISWPSFTYQSGAVIQITITYVCATGTYTSTASVTLP